MHAELPGSTQLLLRHAARWRGRRALIIDPPDAASLHALADEAVDAHFLARDYGVVHRAGGESERLTFAPWLELAAGMEPFEAVILFLPKGRELLAMSVAMARRLIAEGGELLLVGGNREGVKSAGKRLEGPFRGVLKVDSARHCLLYAATPDQGVAGGLDSWERRWGPSDDAPLTIASLPGVFSHGRLDEGTARLLERLKLADAHGRVLDLGCGAGVIGALIAHSHPGSSVELVDSSALAVEASRRTLALNGIDNARAYPSDAFSEVRERFHAIVTNPPFHQGVATDYRVHAQLAAGAADHLEPHGVLIAVVNRFLPLDMMLGSRFQKVETLFEDRRFRVFRAAKGPR